MINRLLSYEGWPYITNFFIELINLLDEMTCLFRIHIINLFRYDSHWFVLFQLLHLLLGSLLPLIQLFYIVFGQLYRLFYIGILLTQTLVLSLLILGLVHLLSNSNSWPKSIWIPTGGCSSPISHQARPISMPKLHHIRDSSPHFEFLCWGELAIMKHVDWRDIDSKLPLICKATFFEGNLKVYVIIN